MCYEREPTVNRMEALSSGAEPGGVLMVWTAARWVIGAIGIALLAGAFWGGGIGMGGSIGFGPTQLAALTVGMVALGGALAGKRLPSAYGTGAVLVLNTFLLLSSIELGAAVLLPRNPSPAATPLPGESSPYYREKPWAPAYWREFHALSHDYHPYFLWRVRPFRGRLINVDSNGLRVTPGAHCEPGAYQVDAFGGSTLWGWGEPDSSTLAAQIQAELAGASARPVCVRNFAQLGSNSTQDLIQLLRELQVGRVPDLVIFYSGVNEIIPPYGYGEAGTHFDLRIIGSRLEGALDQSRPAGPSLRTWASSSSLWRLVSRMRGGRRAVQPAGAPRSGGPFITRGLADSIASTFVANLIALDAIARRYGFRYEVFWQPNALVGRKPLTPEEQTMRAREGITPLVEFVYSRMSCVAARYEHLHDLSDVFAGEPALVYLDWNHVNLTGNRVVARAIAQAVSASHKHESPWGQSSQPPPVPPKECLSHPTAAKSQAAGGSDLSRHP